MSLKRKLGIAAVLVVAVAATLFLVSREPESMLDVTFVRNGGKDGGVIWISNRNRFEVVCMLIVKAPRWGIIQTVPRHGALEVKVPAELSALRIGGVCRRTPSQTRSLLWRLQTKLGIHPHVKKEQWEILIDIPPPKTPLP